MVEICQVPSSLHIALDYPRVPFFIFNHFSLLKKSSSYAESRSKLKKEESYVSFVVSC